jgi:ribonuclease-3
VSLFPTVPSHPGDGPVSVPNENHEEPLPLPSREEESEIHLQQLFEKSGIQPQDYALYRQAMTHSSYLNEQGLPSWEGNERLEFLGDAVIGLVVTETLYQKYPQKNEGELSKIKSVVVSRTTLARCSKTMGLSGPLRLGIGETKSGGKGRHSILAAVFESFVGALFLDLGLPAARTFILTHLEPAIEELGSGKGAQDDKSQLQELIQRKTGQIPRYRIIRSEGPDHNKWFEVEVGLRGTILAHGEGSSKKSAEQHAAQQALLFLSTQGEELLIQEGSTSYENSTC